MVGTNCEQLAIEGGRMALLKRLTERRLPKDDLKVFLRKARVALTPRGRMLTTRLSSGAVVYGANRAGFGARKVFIYGDAVEPEFEHLEEFLTATGVFVEIGANTGKYTIKAAKHYGDSGVVLAVEPFLEMLSTLSRSIDANGFTNVRLRNFCVADRMSIGTLWMNRGEPHKFSLVRSDETASGFSTLTVSLDELFRWEELDRLDYLKIDAEGAEEQVLWGGHDTLEKYRPIIQVDVTLSDVSIDLPDYSGFRAPRSAAKFYIPNEHEKVDVPRQLGWRALV